MTITPSTGTFQAGDVLTCGSDGYDPVYTWSGTTGVDNDDASPGNPFTLPEGPFDLTCTAEVSKLTCTQTTTIMETAYSKYWKQRNTFLIITVLLTLSVALLANFDCCKCLFWQLSYISYKVTGSGVAFLSILVKLFQIEPPCELGWNFDPNLTAFMQAF